MNKKLNITSITNELSEGSSFFPSKKTPSLSPPTKQTGENPQVFPGVPPAVPHTVPRPEPRTVPLIPKSKRPIKQRQPFDIYEDQYERLKIIAESEKEFINGRGMSQMVRDAIDYYFKDRTSSKE